MPATEPRTDPKPLRGLRVAAFEARMAGPMADLIRKHGGEPVEAPALREVPIGHNPLAVQFAHSLIADKFDLAYHTKHVDTIFKRVFG